MIEETDLTPAAVERFWTDVQDGEGKTFTLPAGGANYTDVIPNATDSSGGADALPALVSALVRVTGERDRARDLAARLEEQLARVAEVVHGMETLRYVGMTSARVISDVEAAAQKQRAVRAHAADLRAALTGGGA